MDDFAGPGGGTDEAESSAPGGNSNSIWALLNAAEHIAGSIPSQQLPSAGSLTVGDPISPESLVPVRIHVLANEGESHGSGWDTTVSGQPEFWTDRGDPVVNEPYFWSDGGEPMVSGQPLFWSEGGDPVFRHEFDMFKSVTQN